MVACLGGIVVPESVAGCVVERVESDLVANLSATTYS